MTLMDNSKLKSNRVIFGRICYVALIIAMIGVVDALVASYRKPVNDIDLIAGRSIEMIGKVYGNTKNIGDISFTSDSNDLTLLFDEKLFSGYWLGEEMWRAKLKADSYLPQGKYLIKIIFKNLTNIKPEDRIKVEKLSTYTVNVYSDAKALRQSSLSFIKRLTAISPWSIVAAFFPIILISGGLIFIISGKIEIQMAKQGVAEIYRVMKHENGLEVFFGLGRKHGLEAGEKMRLMSESGEILSDIVVENIGKENSSAVTDFRRIRPGYLIARIGSR